MDPEVEHPSEENKYGVTKSETRVDSDEAMPVQTSTETTSRGLFGLGGSKSDTSSSSESESEEGKERQQRRREERAARKRPTTTDQAEHGTDYSVESIEGGKPTGGTDYTAATALEGGAGKPTGTGTDYSGQSVEGGNPTGGTDFSGQNLVQDSSTNTITTATPAVPEKKHHHLFGL